jgi:hypothetical protein
MRSIPFAVIIIALTSVGCSRSEPPPVENSSTPASQPDSPAVASEAKSEVLTESQKIERLIAAVESAKEAVFIRNGTEYSAQDAAGHLRRKLDAAKGKITTASQFIEHIASKSSMRGNPTKFVSPTAVLRMPAIFSAKNWRRWSRNPEDRKNDFAFSWSILPRPSAEEGDRINSKQK